MYNFNEFISSVRMCGELRMAMKCIVLRLELWLFFRFVRYICMTCSLSSMLCTTPTQVDVCGLRVVISKPLSRLVASRYCASTQHPFLFSDKALIHASQHPSSYIIYNCEATKPQEPWTIIHALCRTSPGIQRHGPRSFLESVLPKFRTTIVHA